MESPDKMELEWSVAQRAMPGENLSGDGHLVVTTPTGWLLAVIDGLGHGPEAATAAKSFIEVIAQHSEEEPVKLIRLSHEALKSTRGGVGAVVTIDSRRRLLCWLGVGNVEGLVLHADATKPATEYITTRGGIIGYRLPELQPSFLQVKQSDMLVLTTDGVKNGFTQSIPQGRSAEQVAAYILDRYAKATDDALVLVARWRFSKESSGRIRS